MDFIHPRSAACSPNTQLMLEASLKGLSPQERRSLGGKFDLQEPVATLFRYAEPQAPGASAILSKPYVRGQMEGSSMMAQIVRFGDADLIGGALSSAAFKSPRVLHQTQGFNDPQEPLPAVVAREALAQADLKTLDALAAALEGDLDSCARAVSLHGSWHGEYDSPLSIFALAADLHSEELVKACALWILKLNEASYGGMLIRPAIESPKQIKEREASAKSFHQRCVDKLLDLGLRSGSEMLAKAACDLGARFDYNHVALAAEHCMPRACARLWSSLQETLSRGGGGEALKMFDSEEFLSGLKDKSALKASERKLKCLEHMAAEWGGLSLKINKKTMTAWDMELWARKKDDVEAFLGLLVRQADQTEGGSAMAGPILALSSEFKNQALWSRQARQAYKRPHPSEFSHLAQAGKWALLKTRIKDAERYEHDERWSDACLTSCLELVRAEMNKSFGGGYAGQKKEKEKDTSELASVKAACLLSGSALDWPHGLTPLGVLSKLGGLNQDELDGIFAKHEAAAIGSRSRKTTAVGGSLRV